MVLTPSQAEQISGIEFLLNMECMICLTNFIVVVIHLTDILNAGFPGVIRVIPNKILNLQTTRSWDFLQVKSYLANGILSEGQSGMGTIIGVLDTGWCRHFKKSSSILVSRKSSIYFFPIIQEYGRNPGAL